jgi:hypothetical protein
LTSQLVDANSRVIELDSKAMRLQEVDGILTKVECEKQELFALREHLGSVLPILLFFVQCCVCDNSDFPLPLKLRRPSLVPFVEKGIIYRSLEN